MMIGMNEVIDIYICLNMTHEEAIEHLFKCGLPQEICEDLISIKTQS